MISGMNEIDFLPERIKARRARRRRLTRQGYLLAVAVAALTAWAGLGNERIVWARGELAMLEEVSASMDRQIAIKAQMERQLADLMVKERVSKTLGSRVNVLDVAHELERLLPEGMFLKSLRLETIDYHPRASAGARRVNASRRAQASSGRKKAKSVKRLRLTIIGLAPSDVSVANFIGQLSASPIFEDVMMGYTNKRIYRKRAAREFQTSCYVVR